MSATMAQQIAALHRMPMAQLRERYAELFGDATHWTSPRKVDVV
jgi:hypothetical protein